VNLPVGGTIVYTVTANTQASATTDLVNTATVAVPTGFSDPDPANNTSTDTDIPTPLSADLSITKDDGQTGYLAGGTLTYTVTVTNLTGADVTGALVSDAKPANISSWAWACTSQTGNAAGCTAAAASASNFTDTVTLPVGGTITYTVTATVAGNATGNLVNTASVEPPSGIGDTDLSNNSSTDTDVLSEVDLAVTKDDGQVTFAGSSVVTYTVTVTNRSGITATGATISDPRPANISTWAWTCTMSGGASGCDPAADSANDFTDTVNLPVNGTIVYTVTANVAAGPTGNLVNTVTVDPPNGFSDSDNTNNSSTDTDTPFAADLSLTKTSSAASASAGDNVTFTLTLKNIGPDTAYGVEVTDEVPSGFTYLSFTASKGSYDNVTGVWTVGDMAVNATETLKITAQVNASGNYTNVAEITQSLVDPAGTIPLPDPDSTPDNGDPDEDDFGESKITIKADPGPEPKPNPGPFLIPVTGFQPGVVTDMSRVPHEAYLAAGDIRLELPSLGVNISIVGVPKRNGTWNVAWLEDQAGWLEGSAFPSWNGNSVLTSHVYLSNGLPGPFVNLNKLKFGDRIIVHAYGQKYTFKVQTNMVVSSTDKSMMKHEEKPWLTLVTCKDYDPRTNTYLNRVLVRALLVSVDWE
jgi:LPXTG-site transpeptidase (sortase) family protein